MKVMGSKRTEKVKKKGYATFETPFSAQGAAQTTVASFLRRTHRFVKDSFTTHACSHVYHTQLRVYPMCARTYK